MEDEKETETIDTKINQYLEIQAQALSESFNLERWNISQDDVCEIIIAVSNHHEKYGEASEKIINLSSVLEALETRPDIDLYHKFVACLNTSKKGGLGLQGTSFSRNIIQHANNVNLIRKLRANG